MKLLNILIVIYINSCGANQSKDSTQQDRVDLKKKEAITADYAQDLNHAPECGSDNQGKYIYIQEKVEMDGQVYYKQPTFYTCTAQGWEFRETL